MAASYVANQVRRIWPDLSRADLSCSVSGWLGSFHLRAAIMLPYLKEYISRLLNPAESQLPLCSIYTTLIGSCSTNPTPTPVGPRSHTAAKEATQHKLTAIVQDENAEACLESAPSDKDAARLRSVRGRGVGAQLEAIPAETMLAFKTSEFCLAASLRFAISLPFNSWNIQCQCRKRGEREREREREREKQWAVLLMITSTILLRG